MSSKRWTHNATGHTMQRTHNATGSFVYGSFPRLYSIIDSSVSELATTYTLGLAQRRGSRCLSGWPFCRAWPFVGPGRLLLVVVKVKVQHFGFPTLWFSTTIGEFFDAFSLYGKCTCASKYTMRVRE